jgi:hypothetical protein
MISPLYRWMRLKFPPVQEFLAPCFRDKNLVMLQFYSDEN